MDTQITSLIHKQINSELFSSYLYYNFANYFANANLNGFENWFLVQAKEELDHALLFTKYLHNNNQTVELQNIERPIQQISSLLLPFQLSYEHEKKVSSHINLIYENAFSLKDFRTTQLLDWFIKEQGEEEKIFSELVSKMELFGSDPKSLYLLNVELSSRVYSAPSLVL